MATFNDTDAAKYYNKQPKKRIGAGILFFNDKNEVLIIKPTYLDKWIWIGGSCENNETPKTTALRECQEEIGLKPSSIWLAFVNYLPPQPTGQSDIIQFLFTCDIVDNNFINKLKLQKVEVETARFIPIDDLDLYMHEYRARAIKTYWKNKQNKATIYMEDGAQI